MVDPSFVYTIDAVFPQEPFHHTGNPIFYITAQMKIPIYRYIYSAVVSICVKLSWLGVGVENAHY